MRQSVAAVLSLRIALDSANYSSFASEVSSFAAVAELRMVSALGTLSEITEDFGQTAFLELEKHEQVSLIRGLLESGAITLDDIDPPPA